MATSYVAGLKVVVQKAIFNITDFMSPCMTEMSRFYYINIQEHDLDENYFPQSKMTSYWKHYNLINSKCEMNLFAVSKHNSKSGIKFEDNVKTN